MASTTGPAPAAAPAATPAATPGTAPGTAPGTTPPAQPRIRVWNMTTTNPVLTLCPWPPLDTPPDRKTLLQARSNDARRISSIVRRGNAIVKGNATTKDRTALSDDEIVNWLDAGSGATHGYQGTLDQAEADCRAIIAEFDKGVDAKNLGNGLATLQASGSLPAVNKIVSFGLGSFMSTTDSSIARGIINQYAVARLLAAAFEAFGNAGKSDKEMKPSIPVFVQDPSLSKFEIDVLTRLGFQVVNPYLHEGFYLVDRQAVVLSVNIDASACLEQMVLECSDPGIIIWTSASALAQTPGTAAAYRTLNLEYAEISDFIGQPQHPLHSTRLYIRKKTFEGRVFVNDDPDPMNFDGQDEFEVDVIDRAVVSTDAIRGDRRVFYRATWTGRPDDAYYYPAENFRGAPRLVRQYHESRNNNPAPPGDLAQWEQDYVNKDVVLVSKTT